MLSKSLIALTLAVDSAFGFPWVGNQPGIDSSLLRKQYIKRQQPSQDSCPFNPNHKGAAKFNSRYPYNGAQNGLPGKGKGGYQVPAPGDTAHEFVPPDYSRDIRGPCPGLNAAANHNFLSHDGIVTFNELVDAQQNVYNVGYDLAVLLAVLGLTTTDGDPVTMKLSIGCDATSRTSAVPLLTGSEPGLNGHNKFEADTSLTRNDYFSANGDNYRMNATLFGMMQDTCKGDFNREHLALYRYQRYQQSLRENTSAPFCFYAVFPRGVPERSELMLLIITTLPSKLKSLILGPTENFYFGPFSLLLFGASSFLYELFPNGNHNYAPDLETISSFFGASQESDGSFTFNGQERIPPNWTNRVSPYTNTDVSTEILAQYLLHPVQFGGNTGDGQFNAIDGPNGIAKGNLTATDPNAVLCFLYQLSTERIPSGLNGILTPTVEAVNLAVKKLGPFADNLGCPLPLT
ncbi:MAG: hypothetical protein M1831_000497 [Alyxoria varia]|nr:MAG: hypothetical protein M1831_000497 [Alyxoria varia]